MFFLRHRSQKVCKSPFPMTIPFWPCLLLCQHASCMSLTHGQRRAKWNIVWILFFFYSLDVSNAFMDSHAHYLAPFLMCASVVPREKVVWSVREKGPKPGGNCSQLRAHISQLPSSVLVGNRPPRTSIFLHWKYIYRSLNLRPRLPNQPLLRGGPGVDRHVGSASGILMS